MVSTGLRHHSCWLPSGKHLSPFESIIATLYNTERSFPYGGPRWRYTATWLSMCRISYWGYRRRKNLLSLDEKKYEVSLASACLLNASTSQVKVCDSVSWRSDIFQVIWKQKYWIWLVKYNKFNKNAPVKVLAGKTPLKMLWKATPTRNNDGWLLPYGNTINALKV